MRLHAALALAAYVAPISAIFEDDAYHIDFHHALVGLPKQDATFFQKPYAASKASLLYTISQNNTVGAVNPKDGALVWRHAPPQGLTGAGTLRAGEDQDSVVSGAGDRITAWSASDGRIVWETKVDGATVEDVEILEQEDGITNNDVKDVIVLLSKGEQGVKRLDGKTGRVKWTYSDASGDTPFQVSSSPTTIYYISLHATLLGGSKLRVTALSPVTGKKLDQYTLNSDSEVQSRHDILFAGANTAAPLLAWTDKSKTVVKVNIIGTKGETYITPPGGEPVQEIILHAPNRVNSLAHFLVEFKTLKGNSAAVYHVDLKKNAVKKAYDLPGLFGRGTFSVSTSDANVYFTRITLKDVSVFSSTSNKVLGSWDFSGSSTLTGSWPVQAVSEVVVKGGSATAVRSGVLFSNGQWVLVRNGEVAWERPEFLSGVVSAVWAELPEEEALAHELEVEGHQNVLAAYIHRVQRHIRDLEYLPAWLQNIPKRILGNVAGESQESAIEEIHHDTFGFHKLVVVASESGRLAALDVGSQGKLVWNVDLHNLAPNTEFRTPSLKSFRGYVEVKDPNFQGSLYVNSTTGGLLSSQDISVHPSIVPEGQQVVSFELVDGQLKGFFDGKAGAEPVWTFAAPGGESIVGYSARPIVDPVASIGNVLGDRRVLYKYLNPNLVLVTAILESARRASLYLLDSASGQLLHAVSHADVDTTRPIPSTISENWFSYSLTLDSQSSSARGYQLVVAELYESAFPDDRGPLGASSNASTVQPTGASAEPHVISQTYQIQEEISHMTVTQTQQGITSRELLVTLPMSNSIVGIPRSVIDPRRPIGRDPTANEAAEGLTRYTPQLLFDPKWQLNHNYELVGIKNVIASESGLESTSLVFAYGQDVFGTRVAPSFTFDVLGKGFNKIQMLLTVAALFVSVLFVAPLVQRKQINTLWTS
ncbi:hypothetical protein B0J11DRAFT_469751 [Dendryphion nanum]|uniref:ER membrane protein complex subunit 1 n=1 Tax=Dendryphion nanum TaxID=256645 RepID=A0A9P9IDT9_9PLEO|nr:hypothetical protein B0J11DRAFT_469751 [Dendryphion nanum]